MTRRRIAGTLVVLVGVAVAGAARAQSSLSLEELAKLRANVLSGLRSLTLQYQHNFNYPSGGHSQAAPSLQAIWPFPVSKNWSLITDTVVVGFSQYDPSDGRRVSGLGDTLISAGISPDEITYVDWALGAALQVPTATNTALGPDLWAAGPAVAVYVQPGNWTIGGLFENIWSFAGTGDGPLNEFSVVYNVSYNLPRGWFVESNSTITAEWQASAANAWTVPVGAGFGKVFTLSARSLSLSAQSFYNVLAPDGGPEWSVLVAAQLLLPD